MRSGKTPHRLSGLIPCSPSPYRYHQEEKASASRLPTAAPSIPATALEWKELILSPSSEADGSSQGVVEWERSPRQNSIVMVAWRLTVYTPEYPKCRQLILIANDITFSNGIFGTQEDLLFQRASKIARKVRRTNRSYFPSRSLLPLAVLYVTAYLSAYLVNLASGRFVPLQEGIPRWYFAANSGARIGLAEEVRGKFRVAFTNSDPFKGMAYLYLTPAVLAGHVPLPALILSSCLLSPVVTGLRGSEGHGDRRSL